MFLNDAVDESFDRRYRPERPIVSGRISARAVWVLSCLWLVGGWLTLLPLGKSPTRMGSLLVAAIVFYDVVHKRTELAPFLMAACRFLLYLVAASAAAIGSNSALLWRAAALAAYVVGLSYLARGESTGTSRSRWTVALVLVPAVVAFIHPGAQMVLVIAIAVCQAAWTLRCVAGRTLAPGMEEREKAADNSARGVNPWRFVLRTSLPDGVAGLLAGIVLVDWLAAVGQGYTVAFLCLFLLAILLQRLAPAT
jgi:4-hydroxybenzoate polyprenyltransferase